jgi:hypothetical protein
MKIERTRGAAGARLPRTGRESTANPYPAASVDKKKDKISVDRLRGRLKIIKIEQLD